MNSPHTNQILICLSVVSIAGVMLWVLFNIWQANPAATTTDLLPPQPDAELTPTPTAAPISNIVTEEQVAALQAELEAIPPATPEETAAHLESLQDISPTTLEEAAAHLERM